MQIAEEEAHQRDTWGLSRPSNDASMMMSILPLDVDAAMEEPEVSRAATV
jgi:hypothetical protein